MQWVPFVRAPLALLGMLFLGQLQHGGNDLLRDALAIIVEIILKSRKRILQDQSNGLQIGDMICVKRFHSKMRPFSLWFQVRVQPVQ